MDLSKIPRINIAFQGGAYGHYVRWLLFSLLVDGKLNPPWDGSTSHNLSYQGSIKGMKFAAGVRGSADSIDPDYKITLSHPVTDFEMQYDEQIDKISKLVDKVIIPYSDHSTYLLGVNNYIYKIVQDSTWTGPLEYVNMEDFLGWGIDPLTNPSDIPRWILREHHSLNIFDMWESQNGWFAPLRLNYSNCKFVFISDLFYNFLPTIESIRQFLEVEWVRDSSELLPYHKTNVSKQQYKNQDLIAKQILQSIADDTDFTWNADNITLYTEAYIQRALQQQGIMLKCNGLNDFPTSTKALIEVFE